jgi:predicted nucleic acid-binding protein
MSDKAFLDTNVLIYAIDSSPEESRKSSFARNLIHQHIAYGTGVISIQVVQEFYVTATRKIAEPLSTDQALEYLNYLSILEMVRPDYAMVAAAIHIHRKYQLPFWDAMIIQAAVSAGCREIFSEDLNDGLEISGTKLVNPFA